MIVVVDTGILLRYVNRRDPEHLIVRAAVRALRNRGDQPATFPQNLAEFWNVSTRPTAARGGYGQSIASTHGRLRSIERLYQVVPEHASAYEIWKQIVLAHSVRGVQVHDARLVALMTAHLLTHILTLNPADFQRYPGIIVLTPAALVAAP